MTSFDNIYAICSGGACVLLSGSTPRVLFMQWAGYFAAACIDTSGLSCLCFNIVIPEDDFNETYKPLRRIPVVQPAPSFLLLLSNLVQDAALENS